MNQKCNRLRVYEAAKKYGISSFSIYKLIEMGKLTSVEKTNKGQMFLEDELIDVAALGDYIVIDEVAAELGLKNSQVAYLIQKGFLDDAKKFNNKWRIARKSLDQYKALMNQTEKLLTTNQVAKRLGVKRSYVNQLILKGKLIWELNLHRTWYISLAELERYEKTILDRSKYLTIEETAKLLSKTNNQVRKLNKRGILDFVDYKRKWYIPIESVKDYKTLLSITTPEDLFSYYFRKLNIPSGLQQTLSLYYDFFLLRLSSSRQNKVKMKATVHKHVKVADQLIRLLSKEINTLNDKQIEILLKNDMLLSSDINVLVAFLNYCAGIVECTYSKTYMMAKKKSNEQEIYTPAEFYDYYLYVKDYEMHMEKASNKRKYAVVWVYILMHFIDAWRHSDIMTKLPAIPIEIIDITSFDDFKPLTANQAQIIINHVFSSMEKLTISKTGALGHFLVHDDMIRPTAMALTIAELHRRKADDDLLLRLYHRSDTTKVDKELHLEPFFGHRTDLLHFQSRKMNRSLLTYFYYSVVEGKKHADIAYELSQWLRGHTDLDSTATYIKSTNKDGSIDRVSLNLVNRGHFGWLYHFIVEHYFDSAENHTMEERTTYMMALREEYTPVELESLSHFLMKRQHERESLALQIAKMPKQELTHLLYRISRGEMPAKIKHGQCFTYPECNKPTAVSCLSCEHLIPKTYLLISMDQEIKRRIQSIQTATYPAMVVRDYQLLVKLLDLLSQASKEFGKDYVETYISLTDLKIELSNMQPKLLLMEELENDIEGGTH